MSPTKELSPIRVERAKLTADLDEMRAQIQ